MKHPTLKLCLVWLTLASAGAWVWMVARAQAQPAIGTASGFSTSEYFDAPHEKQVKMLITGTEAQPQPGGRYLIKQLKLEKFHEDGQREITVEAPECLYDSMKRQASSSGHLRVETGDGRFQVEGEGFLCVLQADKSSLTISNRVHTIIRESPKTKSQP